MFFVIRAKSDDSFLSGDSKSRGSQAGVCRLWSTNIADALMFDTIEEAQASVEKNFSAYEREDVYIEEG